MDFSPFNHTLENKASIYVVVDSFDMPIRAIVTDGTTFDCKKAIKLLAGFKGKCVLADKGYDSDEIVEYIRQSGMEPMIPPRKSRKEQRYYDLESYKSRYLVENLFLKNDGAELRADTPKISRLFKLLSPFPSL